MYDVTGMSPQAADFGERAAAVLAPASVAFAVAPAWASLYLRVGGATAERELERKTAFDRACEEWWEATRALATAGEQYWSSRWPAVAADLHRESLV